LWLAAVAVTAGSAFWQRLSGPTYPVSGQLDLGGLPVQLRLERSHDTDSDQPISIQVEDPAVEGEVAWRRFPTEDPWQLLPLSRLGATLGAALPRQPAAGKLEVQVRLRRGQASAVFPERPAIIRFKGPVDALLLVPHILLVFAGMLLSTRAGLAALVKGGGVRWLSLSTLSCLALGGLLLGPLVQKAAFGAYWTGWPLGHDLTDNKMAVAVLAWGLALWRLRGSYPARSAGRWAVLAAALITLAIFAIPHSTWGSEIDWKTVGAAPA
jgi:hypothetical protein